MVCIIFFRNGTGSEKRFPYAVSEILENPSAQAAIARIWNENFELA